MALSTSFSVRNNIGNSRVNRSSIDARRDTLVIGGGLTDGADVVAVLVADFARDGPPFRDVVRDGDVFRSAAGG
jgi:hypothetical protein